MVDLKQKSVAVQQAETQIPNIDSQVKGTQVMSTQFSAVNKTLIDQQYDLKKLALLLMPVMVNSIIQSPTQIRPKAES